MLTNATILRIDLPGTPSGGGEKTYVTGAALSARCMIRDMDEAAKVAAGVPASLMDVQMAVAQVPIAGLQAALEVAGYSIEEIPVGSHVAAIVDRATAAVTYRVHSEIFRSKGPLSHQELTMMVD